MSQNKKLERDIESTAASKLLVICVDRDDDVGKRRCRFKLNILCS